ncbi:MAG: WYL domain-containing protein [Weeksellaceae bacterium]|nr:WYL domain-containing protein [Bacteroidota bacterium]MCG2781458.1 WYL domain-containing protein [Weeksellaceae bacterium]
MAKNEQILRIKFIEILLRERKDKGASYEEIEEYLEDKFADKDLGEELKFSKKTFERDKKAIAEILGIGISYSRKRNAYYISDEELESSQDSVFDNLLLVQAYRDTKDKTDIMFFEDRKSRGLHHLHGLVHAIMNRKLISVHYHSFSKDDKNTLVLEPYALKEFRHRWYLLAKEFSKNGASPGTTGKIKAYGLDRISELEIKKSTFRREKYDVAKEYRDLFGIVSKNDHSLEEVVLSFDAHQGQYIKSLPLHHSQEIITDNEKELRIRLTLYPTYDFKQEILSQGERVTVISPKAFRDEVEDEYRRILKKYEN